MAGFLLDQMTFFLDSEIVISQPSFYRIAAAGRTGASGRRACSRLRVGPRRGSSARG